MIPRKLVETFFRRLWVLAIPILVVPAVALALAEHPVEYESSARIWVSPVEQVTATSGQTSTPSEKTQSELQVELLGDLLATDAFRLEIATEAGLVAADAPPSEQLAAILAVGNSVSIGSLGPNLFGLSARSASPDEAQRIVAGVIARYQERIKTDADRQAAIVQEYFRTQLGIAEAELTRAQAAVAVYVKDHPLATDLLKPDAEYLRLQSKVDAQVKLVDRLNASLQDAQLAAASEPESQLASFSVQDEPSVPTAPLPVSLMTKAAYPAAGLFLGIFIAAAFLYISYRTDHSIRSREDLADLPVPLLGYVPELRPARRSRLTRMVPRRLLRRSGTEAAAIASGMSPVIDQSAGAR